MTKPLRILLAIAGVVVGGVMCLFVIGLWAMSHRSYSVPAGQDILKQVTGRWDWSTRAHPCTDSAQVISFSPDGALMSITLEYLHDSASRPSVYDVQAVTSGRIRGAIRGEKRLTDAGAPVAWDLVLFGPDEFRWHRTDWTQFGFTAPMQRCGRALTGDDRDSI
jgi:hypothetical protein